MSSYNDAEAAAGVAARQQLVVPVHVLDAEPQTAPTPALSMGLRIGVHGAKGTPAGECRVF